LSPRGKKLSPRPRLEAAGYCDERIVVLATSGDGYIARMSPVGVDQLRKAGVNVDLQTMDFPTLVRRRESKERPDKGGWNIYFNIIDDLFNLNPAMNSNIRADGPAQEGRLSFFHGILRSPRNPPEAKSRHGPAVRAVIRITGPQKNF
jgi:peptide/nickel transport system substrate-binding protein